MRGILILDSRWRWTRFAARPRTRDSRIYPAAKNAVSPLPSAAAKADILLLDEPTNISMPSLVSWLEQHLQKYEEHISRLLNDDTFATTCGWILELDRGEGIPWKGNYSSWLEQKQVASQRSKRPRTKRAKTLERELEWIAGRRRAVTRNRNARINDYEKMVATESEKPAKSLRSLSRRRRLGDVVIEAHGVFESTATRAVRELNFHCRRAASSASSGRHGAGKTLCFA